MSLTHWRRLPTWQARRVGRIKLGISKYPHTGNNAVVLDPRVPFGVKSSDLVENYPGMGCSSL